jgi:predicted alpha/beta hydrolase
MSTSSATRDVRVEASDGYALVGTLYESTGPCRARVLINSATGVRRRYYRKFSEYLAGAGFEVFTYDYRGIGDSAPASIRESKARMRDWGLLDFPAVVRWSQFDAPDRRLFAVGHSVGGQVLGLAENNHAVAGFVGISAQKPWWGYWPAHEQWRLRLLWNYIMPGLSRALGYFPSPWFGLGENLPLGVALEWAAWCRAREHVTEVIGEHVRPGFENWSGAMLAFSFEDDSFAPEASVAALVEMYRSADRQHRHVRPADVGQPIGHFGFFRDVFRDTLWPQVRYWLEDRCSASGS